MTTAKAISRVRRKQQTQQNRTSKVLLLKALATGCSRLEFLRPNGAFCSSASLKYPESRCTKFRSRDSGGLSQSNESVQCCGLRASIGELGQSPPGRHPWLQSGAPPPDEMPPACRTEDEDCRLPKSGVCACLPLRARAKASGHPDVAMCVTGITDGLAPIERTIILTIILSGKARSASDARALPSSRLGGHAP